MTTIKTRFDDQKHRTSPFLPNSLTNGSIAVELNETNSLTSAVSLWSDPAAVVGVAIFVGKMCRSSPLAFPNSLLSLLHQHAEKHDFACKLAIVWLYKNAIIADLDPPKLSGVRTDA